MLAFLSKIRTSKLAVAAASALMLAGTTAAQAHHHDDHHGRLDIDLFAPVLVAPERVEPVYEDREVQVLVPAVYRTVVDRVWREPVCRTVCERVVVPAVWQCREVRRSDGYRVWSSRDRILIAPAHVEERQRQEIVCQGHFEDVARQELVCEAHYETRVRPVAVGERACPQPHCQGLTIAPGVEVRLGR